ncbi:GrpB family protein [Halobacillus campisalis]|uniref:GrpB family protein n=1 Tax=Halobacillus campisalis TaxID=435909 RepID=A0ABW2K5K8_9BACI
MTIRKIEVRPFDRRWESKFRQEASAIEGIFGRHLVDIHHIGSTAIEGMKAKPIIDIMPVLDIISRADEYVQAMEASGYEVMGENGIQGRRFYQKGGDERSHHVHIFEAGHPEIERHLVFRDYLRSHPQDAAAYGELKERLAYDFPHDIERYIQGKKSLVGQIEVRAFEWFRKL